MYKVVQLLIFLFLLEVSFEQAVSRNSKIQSMLDLLKENEKVYDAAIKKYEEKIAKEFGSCMDRTKQDECQNFYIWQQERSKNSKNVTILKEKIGKHNETIRAILQLNKLEVTKKNLTMLRIFPQIKKLKDDIELLQSMIFLIEDTYLQLDLPNKSLLSIFNVPIAQEHSNIKVAKQMKTSFIQLMRQDKADDAAKTDAAKTDAAKTDAAKTDDAAKADATKTDAAKTDAAKTTVAPADDENVPLIDEELFDGEADKTEQADNVFQTEPIPDDIPDGVDVPEHDQDAKTAQEVGVPDPRDSPESQDLRIYEVKEEFKTRVRETGKQMHDHLTQLYAELEKELDGKVQSVLDLEYAIIQLHTKHSKQIVQIYKEQKKLQSEIFSIDDVILKLDAKMHDCMSADKAEEKCLEKKNKDQIVVEDLKTEKAFNIGAQKELEKLLKFQDRMVVDPTPKEEPVQSDLAAQQQQILSVRRSELEKRIQKIKEEEAEVEKEIQQQQLEQQAATLKEAEEQEYKNDESLSGKKDELLKDNQELSLQKLDNLQGQIEEREIDEVLEKVDNELKSEQAEFLLNNSKEKITHLANIQLASHEQTNQRKQNDFEEQKQREKQFIDNTGQIQFLRKYKNSLK